jgi:hypothetical protein
MANQDAANGFEPYLNGHGGGGEPVANEYILDASNTEIGKGTPVVMTSSGGVDIATAGAGNAILGIAAEYKAASAGGTIKVWDDPDQQYTAQTDDGTGTSTAQTVVGARIDFVGTGVSATKLSTAELDEDTGGTGATKQFQVMGLSKEVQKNVVNAFGEFNRLIVKINTKQDAADSAGI